MNYDYTFSLIMMQCLRYVGRFVEGKRDCEDYVENFPDRKVKFSCSFVHLVFGIGRVRFITSTPASVNGCVIHVLAFNIFDIVCMTGILFWIFVCTPSVYYEHPDCYIRN